QTNTVRWTGGPSTINSLSMTGDDILAITGNTLTINNASTLNALTQSGGELAGTGIVTVSGLATWSGGTMSGTGTTQFNGALSITGPAAKTLSGGHTLNTTGTTTWGGNTSNNTNELVFNNSTINNSGTWLDQNAFNARILAQGGTNAF